MGRYSRRQYLSRVSQPPVTAKNTSQDAENAAFTCSIPYFQKVLIKYKRRRLAIAIDGYCSLPFPVVHEPNVVLPHIFHTSIWHATIQNVSRCKDAPYKHPKTAGIHNQHLLCSKSYIRASSRLIQRFHLRAIFGTEQAIYDNLSRKTRNTDFLQASTTAKQQRGVINLNTLVPTSTGVPRHLPVFPIQLLRNSYLTPTSLILPPACYPPEMRPFPGTLNLKEEILNHYDRLQHTAGESIRIVRIDRLSSP